MNVLVVDGSPGGSRSALAAVRALSAGGHRATVTVSRGRSLASASRYCAGTVTVPPADAPGFADAVRTAQAAGCHGAVFPASDSALVALGSPGAQLVDKAFLASRVSSAGLPVLEDLRFSSATDLFTARSDLPYPVVVKPTVRTSARQPPVQRVGGPDELSRLAGVEGPVVVQPFVDAPMSSVSGVVWGGRLRAVATARYLRRWPVEAGVATALVTVDGDRSLEAPLTQVLRGHEGVFQAQFVGPYLIDLNPRVYGSLPLAVAAGANLPGLVCDLVVGREVDVVRARTGVRYRWVEGDLRHALWRARRRSLGWRDAADVVRPHLGSASSLATVDDPAVTVVRIRQALERKRTTT